MVAEVYEGEPGRLDAVVARLADLPRADVQRAIVDGRLLVDGRTRPKSHRLTGGERLELSRPAEGPPPAEAGEPLALRVDDEHLAVVAKPAGLITHPTAGRRSGTLVNRLLGMGMPLAPAGGDLRPGIVHRLDAGTSGLIVVAKTDAAYEALSAMMRAHDVERRYLALVRGEPAHDAFVVEAPLGRRADRIVVDRAEGRPAETAFAVLERLGRVAFVEARPRTGRTHQIRVHLRAVGHPILGDRAYGGGGDDAAVLGLDRPFLHAAGLRFEHPVTGRVVEVDEPLPAELADALDRARRAAEGSG
jgi:23S rRNA pseudouridine1911/1915/1917 synthase